MPPTRRPVGIGILALAGAISCYAFVPVFLRYLARYLDVWTVNGLRYATAAAFWLPFAIALRHRRTEEFEPLTRSGRRRNPWIDAIVPAAVNISMQISWATCPYFINAPLMGFLSENSFLFTILLGFLLVPEERALARHPLFYVGGVLCMAGVVLISVRALTGTGGVSLIGIGLGVLTAFLWGGYGVMVRRFMPGYPARLSFGIISLYTAVGLLTLMFTLGNYGAVAQVGLRVVGLVVLSAIVGIAFSHVLLYRAIHAVGPVVASGVLLAAPFLTLLLAGAILGETMEPIQFAGGLGIVAGAVLLIRVKAVIEKRILRDAPS